MLICYEQSIALRCFSWGKTIMSANTWSALSPEGKRDGLVMVSFVSWSHRGNELDNQEYSMHIPRKESLFNKDTYTTVCFQYNHVLLVLQSLPPSTFNSHCGSNSDRLLTAQLNQFTELATVSRGAHSFNNKFCKTNHITWRDNWVETMESNCRGEQRESANESTEILTSSR